MVLISTSSVAFTSGPARKDRLASTANNRSWRQKNMPDAGCCSQHCPLHSAGSLARDWLRWDFLPTSSPPVALSSTDAPQKHANVP